MIFSPSDLAHSIRCDRRAILRRLSKLEIIPKFITPQGEAFFDLSALHRLELAALEPDAVPQEATL